MNKNIIIAILVVIIIAIIGFFVFGQPTTTDGKLNTQINFLSESTLQNGDQIQIELKDTQGNAVANALVNFTYVANGQEEKYSVYTNNEGKASLILNNEDPGEHQVTAAFGGNEKLNPCSAQQKITIKEGTSTANTTANSGVNSTTSTIAYEGGNQTNTTQHQVPLNYDPETGNLYDNNGIIVGGQNDGQSLEYIKNNRPVIDEDGSLV